MGTKICESLEDSLLGVFVFQRLHVCLFACLLLLLLLFSLSIPWLLPL